MDATELLPTPRNFMRTVRWSFELAVWSQEVTRQLVCAVLSPLLPARLRQSAARSQRSAVAERRAATAAPTAEASPEDVLAEDVLAEEVLATDVLVEPGFAEPEFAEAAFAEVSEYAVVEVIEPVAELPAPAPDSELLPAVRPGFGAEELVVEAGIAPIESPEGPAGEGETATAGEEAPAEDLTRINGIGPRMAERLAHQGITTLAQLAAWTSEDIARFEDHLPTVQRGKAVRDGWVEQARALLAGNGSVDA